MADGADHGGAVVDIAPKPGLHFVEGMGRPPDLGRTVQRRLLAGGIAPQAFGRFGEVGQGGGEAAGKDQADRNDHDRRQEEPEHDPSLPGVGEGLRRRLDRDPMAGCGLEGGDKVPLDVRHGRHAERATDRRAFRWQEVATAVGGA